MGLRLGPLLAVADGLALAGVAWLAHLARFQGPIRGDKWTEVVSHPGLGVVGILLLWGLATAAELYGPLRLRRRRELAVRVAVVGGFWGVGVAAATYLEPSWRFGRGLLALTTSGWVVAAWLVRVGVRRWVAARFRPPALVVGETAAVAGVCDRLRQHPLAPWEPVDGASLSPSELAGVARRLEAEVVVLVGSVGGFGAVASDLATLHFSGVPVVVTSELWAWLDGRLPVDELSPDAFLHQPGFGSVHWQLFNRLTRVLDVLLALVMMIPAAPLVLLGGLLVWLSDGRPVFYLQPRVGQFGRGFRILKLRTMRRDAEDDGPSFSPPGDPRVTPVGRWLRRLRVDELPQLLNVLRGDMSLVGPRPERPEFVADLARQLPYYTFRLAVPPGITGWAQVNMPYACDLDEHRRKLEYDLYFIRERSVGLYLLTLLRTLNAALAGAR
ncbi:MAG TPA: sugar transferase [Thermoanaerobaculaceae bacterium]|nr:sugar transferase [Thermoanaerobaculaceae bacterium]HPS77012.1 sugar transferase [Thermoanaerobaculaceae bacterium]